MRTGLATGKVVLNQTGTFSNYPMSKYLVSIISNGFSFASDDENNLSISLYLIYMVYVWYMYFFLRI